MTTKSTASELRKTGISVVGDMPWGTHLCHFFETKEDLLEILVPYFKAGLENNEFCIWVVSDPLGEEEARNALRQALPETDRYLAKGHIEIIPHTDWYLKDGALFAEQVRNAWKQKLAEALARGYAGLRANGNAAWLTEENWKAFSDYEKTLNESLAGQRMIVLCSYPVTKTGASGLLDVVQSHHYAIARRQGDWDLIESPEPIVAKAEIKRLNEALQRVKERTPKPLPILSYGVAALSVTAALFIARWMQIQYNFEPFVLFLCVMMFSAWFGGIKPGLLALALSLLAFHYYFLIPIYPLGVGKEIPRLLAAALTSLFVVLLSAAQRTKTESLGQARDVLDETVQDLRRTNVALRQENAERKEAEDALRRSEERFAAFMDNLPGYAWMKDLQGRYVYVNEMVRGLPGYRSLGKTDAQIWPADLAAEYRANDQQVIATKKPLPTLEHFQQEGKQRYMAGSKFAIFDKTGTVALVGGVGVDITERIEAEVALRESEQRFRTLVEVMPVAVYVCDTSGIIKTYNKRAVELWGREPKLGDPDQRYCGSLRLYSPEGELVPHQESPVAEVLRTGIEARDQEVVVERPDGSRRTVLANIVPLKNGDGELIGAMNCLQDISERKQAAKELEEAHRQLKILSRRRLKIQEEERRHLARELHDEIGQALTAAKINLQAAMKESDGAKSKRIDETAAILERLLGQVRQISLNLRPSTLDDLGLVPALRSLLDEQGRRASVAVRFTEKDVPENLDPEIQTTCFRIGQEAITNAVRHAGATRIDVDLGRENGKFRMQVSDNGRGFDAESAQAQTVGLGLIGIKERAALVGGRTKIKSSPGKGTTVEATLPLKVQSEHRDTDIEK